MYKGVSEALSYFELTCKNVHAIIVHILSEVERKMIIEAATCYADGLYLTDPNYPIGAMAIPNADPYWVYNSPEGACQ